MSEPRTLRVNLVWIGLSGLTVLSWALVSMRNASRLGPSTGLTVAVVSIAGVKAAGIISEFMEVRVAPRILRVITGAWLMALVTCTIALYID